MCIRKIGLIIWISFSKKRGKEHKRNIFQEKSRIPPCGTEEAGGIMQEI